MNVQIFLLIIFSGIHFCKKSIKSTKSIKSIKYIKSYKNIKSIKSAKSKKPKKPWTYIGKTQEELKNAYHCVHYDLWNNRTETRLKNRKVMAAVLKVKLYFPPTFIHHILFVMFKSL